MNKRALKVLEFYKIKEKLKSFVKTNAAKDIIDNLKPYESLYEVEMHLKETVEALDLLQTKGEPPFEGIYDIRDILIRVEKAMVLLPGQLLKVASILRSARRFKDYVARKYEESPHENIEDICESIEPLKGLEESVFNVVISDDEIADRASLKLYGIRRALRDKNDSLRDRVNSLVRKYSPYLQENIYTIRGDRYVLPVRAEHKGAVPGLVHDQSSSGSTLFIEPMSLVNLNNEIKELLLKEREEVERILEELSLKVYNNLDVININAKIIWELDFIFAKAKFASHNNCTLPKVNEDGVVDIIEGKHLLIDAEKVVPTDIYLGKDFTSLIITGPNTGGKTVTLKTLGLIHIMGLSGLLIPAKENSTIAFFEEIFADIGDEQSIEQSLSTFSSHMVNIVDIISKADNKSLVLFDELGAGTDPTEGAALAISILEELRKRKCKIVATTHYSELKGYALKTEGVENASVEFDVETLKPTYRLLIGVPGKSNAFEISKRLGLSEYIIEEAKKNIESDSLRFEDLIEKLQSKSIKASDDARRAEMYKLEADKLKDKYEDKLRVVEENREKLLRNAQDEARKIIKEAKEEADEILKNIRELERMGYSSTARQKLEEERKKLNNKMHKLEKEEEKLNKEKGKKIEKVNLGEEVYLPKLDQKVIILSKPDNKGEVQVQAGIIKINVKLEDLRVIDKPKEETKKARKREAKLRLKMVEPEIDLRGMDSMEAIYNTDKYLDEAYVAGLKEVILIHGKGTGVLRKSINDMLKRHPQVKRYRLGEYGEGGTGVTVVELK